jgi:RNA polymerase sigma-70 factor (ECF subfamily)
MKRTIDAQVRELVAAGDASVAATLVLNSLGPSVLRYLRSVLRDEEDAADAFSRFAEQLWRGLPGFRGEAALRTWAFRIAFNAAQSLRNDPWHRRGRRFATGEASRLAEELRTKTAIRVERRRDGLERLRQHLSPDEQSLLALRIDQGLAWEEIADILSSAGDPVQPAALTKRFERLKAKLTALVRDQGLGDQPE